MPNEVTEPQVAQAVNRARAAQPGWAATSPIDRARVVRHFHDVLWRRRHEVAAIITRESGKPFTDALGADVLVALDFAAWTARHAPRFLRSGWRQVGGLLFWRKRVRFEKAPIGVIGVIAPWNYPFFLPASCVLPAIACGNAVVLKPSEVTPDSGGILESLWREAGLPDGVLNIVQGDGAAGAALTRSGVDKMIFTGSALAGRKVAQACADQLIPCSLELGGSDAAIVLADADVRHAADGIAWGRFANAGQTCVAPKRVFVEAAAYDGFVAAMGRAVSALKVGHGDDPATEVGPLIHAAAADQVRAQCDDAVSKGARVVATAPVSGRARGHYFPPTLLADVTGEMRVLREEIFGPLLPVVRVKDVDEAVARANDSVYGLSASVWTRDRARGLAVARRLEAGTVLINDSVSVVGMPDVPYGGVKQSGLGRLHGVEGLAACVRSTAVVDDRFASWHQPWWFRYGTAHRAGFEAYGRLAHGASLWERLSGVPGVLRMMLRKKGTA
jgi:succinate-semialdehyde dehydrogenase/glutarate-semialdehyde dehydrogenase